MGKRSDINPNTAVTRACRMYTDTHDMLSVIVTDPQAFTRFVVATENDHSIDTAGQFNDALAEQSWIQPGDIETIYEAGVGTGQTVGEDAIMMQRWNTSKIVYSVHPRTQAAIVATDWADTVIPATMWDQLPHPDPFISLASPIYIHHDTTGFERYDAILVGGIRPTADRAYTRCSTHDPRATGTYLNFVGYHVDVTKRRILHRMPDRWGRTRTVAEVIGMRIAIPHIDRSLPGTITATVNEVAGDPARISGWPSDAPSVTDAITRLATTGVSLAAYICSAGADITTAATHKTPVSPSQPPTPKSVAVMALGYRIGPSLPAPPSPSGAGRPGASTGRSVSGHIRRAHAHTYWTGPGRTIRTVKWLPPIAVATPLSADRVQVHTIT